MTEFEMQTSGIGRDFSANGATTTAQFLNSLAEVDAEWIGTSGKLLSLKLKIMQHYV